MQEAGAKVRVLLVEDDPVQMAGSRGALEGAGFQVETAEDGVARSAEASQSRTVLVAEDDEDLRHVIRITLESDSLRIIEAEDGQAALEAARTEIPEVVLLDWTMPRLSGIEVADTLMRESRTVAMRVVMLTARDDEEDIERGRAAGVFAYLVKPFSPLELVSTIERAFAAIDGGA